MRPEPDEMETNVVTKKSVLEIPLTQNERDEYLNQSLDKINECDGEENLDILVTERDCGESSRGQSEC